MDETKIVGVDFECPSCKKNSEQSKKIPVLNIIQKLDSLFSKNDLTGAKNLLDYWQKEAVMIGDREGELSIVNELLGVTRKMEDKENAIKTIDRALLLIDELGMENSIDGATILVNVATTCNSIGLLARCAPIYERAYKVYESNLDEEDIRFVSLLNNYATTLVDLKEYDKALSLYLKAISYTQMDVDRFLDCAVTYVNIAHLFEKIEGLESEHITWCMDNAEKLMESELIERDGKYAFVCDKLAPSFDLFGYFYFAQVLYERAREIYEGN